MNEYLLTALMFMPLITAAIGTSLLSRRISRHVLFFIMACLSLLGLQFLVAPAVTVAFWPAGGEIPGGTDSYGFNHSVIASAIFVFICGSPLLWWLSHAFRRS